MFSKLTDELTGNSLKLLCFLVFFSSLLVYLSTLNNYVILGDTGEFVAASYELGVPHPPGYPLFTLIGHLFTKLPFGNVVEKIGLVSAIFGSLTSVGVFMILYKLTSSKISSLIGSLTLSFSFIFWLYSVNAEIITLNTFFLISLFSLAYGFKKTKNKNFLYLLSFTFGLSLTNQYSVVALLPALLFLIFKERDQVLRLRTLSILTAAFLLGLWPLIYIPLAASTRPYINWNNASTLEGFISLVTRNNYGVLAVGDYLGGNLLDILVNQIPFYFYDIFRSFGFIAAALFLIGLLPSKKSHTYRALLIALFFTGPFLVGYSNFTLQSPFPDVAINQKRTMETVYVISAPFISIFIGLGIHRITQFRSIKIKSIRKSFIVYSLSLIAFTFPLISNFPKILKSRNSLFDFYGRQVLNSLPDDSLLIVAADDTYIFWYLQVVENLKADTPILNFSMMQNDSYIKQQKERFPSISFPFDNIRIGEPLSDFYEENLSSRDIYFAPFDDQSRESILEDYKVFPEGLTVRLTDEDGVDIEAYKNRQDEFWRVLETNPELFMDYEDLPTQEVQMAYARSWANIGIVYENHEKDDWAIEAYERARLISPKYYLSTKKLADLYVDRGSDYWDRAIDLYLEILTYNSDHADSHKSLGVLYYEKKQFGKSRLYLKEYLMLSSDKEIPSQLRSIYESVKNY